MAVGGETIEPRIRNNGPGDKNTRCRFQVSWISTKSSLNLRSHLHTFNVQRHRISARTHPEFRAPAMNMWREGSRGRLKIFETQTSRVLLSAM